MSRQITTKGLREAEHQQRLVEHARKEVAQDEAKLQHVKDVQEDDRWDRLNERLRLLEETLATIVVQGSENAKHNVNRNEFRNH